MGQASEASLSPTPQYYKILGRAAEIARSMGSRSVGAEHVFLGMLHDSRSAAGVLPGLVDPGLAEAAVLAIVREPGYALPPPPSIPGGDDLVRLWGAEEAFEMGDSSVGLVHAFLAMIRMRETVPARALASLADLGALEAAALHAKNARPGGPPVNAVFLPEGDQMDGPLVMAIHGALPAGTTFAYNRDAAGRTWVCLVGGTADTGDAAMTREVINAALACLNRPGLDTPPLP
jgi:Clp amino terminal domain, pathogenicity island component